MSKDYYFIPIDRTLKKQIRAKVAEEDMSITAWASRTLRAALENNCDCSKDKKAEELT